MGIHHRNRILSSLPADVLASIRPHLTHVKLQAGETLHESGSSVGRVYFMCDGVAAYIKMMSDGRSTLVGTVGVEGMTAHTVALGGHQMISDCIMHIAGTAVAIDTEVLQRLSQKYAPLRLAMRNLAAYMSDQFVQIAACNRLHSLEQRYARILMTDYDNVESGEFRLTQECLAMALGAQRPHVSVVAAQFQRRSLIQYKHGNVRITDPVGLRAVSCECYHVIHDEIALLFEPANVCSVSCRSG